MFEVRSFDSSVIANRIGLSAFSMLSIILLIVLLGLQPGYTKATEAEPTLSASQSSPVLSTSNVCATGEAPLLPAQTRSDAANDVTPAHIDIVQASSTLAGQQLTAVYTLRDVPTELPVNRGGTYYLEYMWIVYIDVDNNANTGASNIVGEPYATGAEYILSATRRGSQLPAETVPIANLIQQTSVFEYRESLGTWYIVDPLDGTHAFDANANTLTLVGNIPNITTSSRLTFTAFDSDAGASLDDHIWDITGCRSAIVLPDAEKAALTALYQKTGGDNWKQKDGWTTIDAPCTWHGITCEGGHVTRLELTGNNLTGTIPAELGNLTMLDRIDLGGNEFTGEIPAALASLTSLTRFDLGDMDLTGAIPAWIGNLSNLDRLDLSDNNLTGSIPAEYANLTKLIRLDIEENALDPGPIPSWLGNLTALEHVALSDLQLTGSIPANLGSLPKLRHLELDKNQLTGCIPPELGNLSTLRYLDLSDNQLSCSIPSELSAVPAQQVQLAATGVLTSLEELDLSINQLTGPIPPEFATLTTLTDLDLGYNFLTASDAGLVTFLNAKDPDWAANQSGGRPVDLSYVYLPFLSR